MKLTFKNLCFYLCLVLKIFERRTFQTPEKTQLKKSLLLNQCDIRICYNQKEEMKKSRALKIEK